MYTQSEFTLTKELRLYRAIKARIAGLEFQKEVQSEKGHLETVDLSRYEADLACLKELESRLVNNSFICNSGYSAVATSWKRMPRTLEEHSFAVFGHYIKRIGSLGRKLRDLRKRVAVDRASLVESKEVKARAEELERLEITVEMLALKKRKCLEARGSELENRFENELLQRVKEGWFVIFNTLTVDRWHYKEVFGDGEAFIQYVRAVDRAVAIRCDGSVRSAFRGRCAGNEYHRYFAVVERGDSSGRLHIHVVHLVRELPWGVYCPNKGRACPDRREISGLKSFWKYGKSAPIAVRFGVSDAFGRRGWRLPVELSEDGNYYPIELKPPAALASYIGKYLDKEYGREVRPGGIRWRARMSRRLGMKVYDKVVESLSPGERRQLMKLHSGRGLKLRGRSVKLRLLRRSVIELKLRTWSSKKASRAWAFLMELSARESLLSKLRRLTGTASSTSRVRTGVIEIGIMSATAYCSIQEKINGVAADLFGRGGWQYCFGGSSREVYGR